MAYKPLKPPPIEDPSDGTLYVERIDALTSAGRANWLGLLAYLIFAFVTVLGVEDADFFIDTRQTQLPLINVAIPTISFFIFAPIIGAALYNNLHLHLLKVSEALTTPNPKPNGQSLERQVKPWLLNDLILRRYHRLAIESRRLDYFSDLVTILLVWLAGPFVLGALWTSSFVVHNFWLTTLAGACFFATILVGAVSWRRMEQDTDAPLKFARLPTPQMYCRAIPLAALIAVYGLVATKGVSLRWLTPVADWADARLKASGSLEQVPTELRLLLKKPVLAAVPNLRETRLSALPPDQSDPAVSRAKYRGDWCRRVGHPSLICGTQRSDRTNPAPFLDGDRQGWCHKRNPAMGADACRDYFDRRDSEFEREWKKFRRAQIAGLPKPDMQNHDIRRADLSLTSLIGVNFRGAQMETVDLSQAQIEGANLSGAKLGWSNFSRAQMERTNFRGAQIEGAVFFLAQMERANFRGAQMEEADLSRAQMENAIFRETSMERANLSRARMEGVKLREALMTGANLRGAQIVRADLSRAHMAGVDFSYSFLAGHSYFANVLKDTNLSASYNSGGALRFVDLRPAKIDPTTDFRNAFLDGSVQMSDDFRAQMGDPCQWRGDLIENDVQFFGLWRTWVDRSPDGTRWNWAAPPEWRDVEPQPLPEDCQWKTGPMPGASAD